MRLYLDQNAFDAVLDGGVSPETVSKAMQEQEHELIVSGDNFQEWASCWKSGQHTTRERGRHLIQFMLGIHPRRLLIPPGQLIFREIRALFGDQLRGPFLPIEDLPAAEALFRRFADDLPTKADLKCMLDHWAVKDTAGARADQQSTLWKGKLEKSPSVDAFRDRHPDEWKGFVRVFVERSLETTPTGKEMKRILDREANAARPLGRSATLHQQHLR
jgi:hypothetical protein